MNWRVVSAFGSVWFALFLATTESRAAGVDTYAAPVSGEDLLQTERAHAQQEHLEPFARASLSYANDPLVLRQQTSERKVLEHQLGIYAAFGVSLWERAHAALLIPVFLQSGAGLPDQAEPDSPVVGDVGLDVRFALLRRDDIVELALSNRLQLPVGSEQDFVGDGSTSLATRVVLSRALGKQDSLLTASLGTSLRSSEAQTGIDTGSELLLSTGGLLALSREWALSGEASLASQFDGFLGSTTSPASALVGVRYRARGWIAHVGGGPGISRGLGTPDYRVVAMVGSDSLASAKPAPVTPEPTPIADTDLDGIADPNDSCPNEAEDVDGHLDEDGCPDHDNDQDGIDDTIDQCPAIAEDRDAFQDEDGCPEPDNDGDGVLDDTDACPSEPEDPDSFQDEDGCPDPDNDQDGVLDTNDACPKEAESPNGVDDGDGCPDLLRVEETQIRTLEPIFFETGSAKLKEQSLPLLTEMAALIAAREDLGVIAIEGHTDGAGSAAFNRKLSQARAESVRTFLIDQGVPEQRLTATGFGEERPIASNENDAGREQNRRVEFRFAGVPSSVDANLELEP